MTAMERFANSIVVPVVVLDKAEDAVPTARAMLAGGIDTMEITFRTACAPEAIRAVAENCPEVLVGAGTVLNLEQAKLAVSMGAKFIVSPGFSEEVVAWCVENGIAVAPGCVTPSEIMSAKKYGLKMVKFFPANVYGGEELQNLEAMLESHHYFGRSDAAGGNRDTVVAAPCDGLFVIAGGDDELCAALDGELALLKIYDRAGADDHVGALLRDSLDGISSGGGTEGDFHNVNAAGEHRLGSGDSVLRVLKDYHGDDTGLSQSFQYIHFFIPPVVKLKEIQYNISHTNADIPGL